MDFLKKNWEKALLTLSLVALIGAAGWLLLKVINLSREVNAPPTRIRGAAPKLPDLTIYSNTLERLVEPSLWGKMEVDPFSPTRAAPSGTNTNKAVDVHVSNVLSNVFYLLHIKRTQFEMRFVAYTGEGENFQINMVYANRTFIVKRVGDEVGDRYKRTGYVVTNFVKNVEEVVRPGVGKRVEDHSQLTLQRPNGKPIELLLGKPGFEVEPVAWIECVREGIQNNMPVSQAITNQIKVGAWFQFGGLVYNVVDIKTNQVLIVEKESGEKRIIGAKPARTVAPTVPGWPAGVPVPE